MKPIYKPKGAAGEYGDYALNIYTGCNHGCSYCYARSMHERFHPDTRFDDVQVRPGLLYALDKQLASGAYKGKLIHLCFTCDPYPADVDTTATREVIKMLKDAGAHVQILTKGGQRAERDFDLLDGEDWFGVTIAGGPRTTEKNEPNAAPLYERYEMLDIARDYGMNKWVSFEPVYTVLEVYHAIRNINFIDKYAIGKLNYYPSDINWRVFGEECERLCKQYGRNYYIKADLRREMER